jgi:hypothetical protein
VVVKKGKKWGVVVIVHVGEEQEVVVKVCAESEVAMHKNERG